MNINELINKKRIRFFAWTLSLTLVLFFFRHAFLGYSSSLLLHYFFPLNSQYQVEFGKVHLHDGGLLCEKFEIRERVHGEGPPSLHVMIPKFTIKFEVSLLNFDIHPKVVVYEPKIYLRSSSKSPSFQYVPSFFKMSKQSHIEIERGQISWIDDQDMASLFLSFEQTSDPSSLGLLSLADSPELLHESPIQLSFSRLGSELICHSSFSEVSFPWVSRILNTSQIVKRNDLYVEEGKMDGQMLFVFNPKGGIERADGSLEGANLVAHSSLMNMKVGCDLLSLDFSYPKPNEKSLNDHPLWTKTRWKTEIKNCVAHLDNATTCTFQGSGGVGYKASNYISLKGTFEHEDQETFFRLKGVPCIDSSHLLSAEILFRDVKNREADSVIDVSISEPETGSWHWEAHLDQISHTFFLALNPFIAKKGFIFEKGSMQGSLRGDFEGNQRYSVEMEGLIINDLHVASPLGKTEIQSALCHGRVLLGTGPLIPYLSLCADHLQHNSSHPHIPSIHSTFVKGHIIDNQFKDSYIIGKVGEGFLETRWKGSIEVPEIHLDLELPSLTLQEMLHSYIKKSQIEPIQNFTLHFDLIKQSTSWNCEGFAAILKQDNKKEKIDLHLEIDPNFMKKSWLYPEELLIQGSFSGKEISPCIYQIPIDLLGMDFKLLGLMEIKGTIDPHEFYLNYSSSHLLFDSEELEVEIREEVSQEKIRGEIRYPFKEKNFYVSMPIKKASSLFKPNQLRFENINGNLNIKGDDLFVQNLQGNSLEGIEANGELYLHFTGVDPDFFDIHVTHFEGYLHQILDFCTHFPEFPTLPFESNGYVTSQETGLRLQSPLNPTPALPDWSVAFALEGGSFEYGSFPLIEDVSLEGSWDSTKETIQVYEIKGEILSESREKKYHFYTPYFESEGLENAIFSLDFRLEDGLFDPLRIIGSGTKIGSRYDLSLDSESSHLFGALLNQGTFFYDHGLGGFGVDSLLTLRKENIECLTSFMSDIGFTSLPENMINFLQGETEVSIKWNSLSQEGLCSLVNPLFYLDLLKPAHEKISAQILAGNYKGSFQIASYHQIIEFLDFKGSYFESKIEIPKATLSLSEKLVKVPFFNIDFDRNFIPEYALKCGLPLESIKTSGSFQLKGEFGFHHLTLDALLSAELIDQKQMWKSATLTPFTFHMNENLTWLIEDLKWGISHISQNENPCTIALSKIEGKNGDSLMIKQGEISLSPAVYKKFLAEEWIPWTHGIWNEWLEKNPLTVSFDLERIGSKVTVQNIQQKGIPLAQQFFWKMIDAKITTEPHEILASALLSNNQQKIVIDGSYRFHQKKEGYFALYDLEQPEEKISLCLKENEKQGFFIESMQGKAFGIDLYFVPKYSPSSEMIVLTGKTSFDFAAMAHYFPLSYQKMITSLEIGKGYEVLGDIVIPLNHWKKTYFEGTIKGRDFEVLGYSLRNFMMQVHLSLAGFECKDFRLSDEGVVVWVDAASLSFEKPYLLDVAKIEINDFRPSLIFKRSMKSKKMKPFVVTHALIQNLKGPLQSLEKIKGSGEVKFTNTSKREYTIFDFPLELISRLGLDLKLLVPIKGDIEFVIENEKLIFKDLKDSISEGKRSHFLLSRKTSSFIDFYGNIHIDIKMKQHVLLKLTQPFTLSIRGNLMQPEFSLQ